MVILSSVNYLGWFIAMLQSNYSRSYMIISFTDHLALWNKSYFQKQNSLVCINLELYVTEMSTGTNLIFVHNFNGRSLGCFFFTLKTST